MGICLGAQLIAGVLGAEIFANSEKEIGWLPVTATTKTKNTFCLPAMTTVFHWHGETSTLPDKAVKLAESIGCSNQAFQHADNVIGLQFHLETTPASAEALVEHCGDELIPGKYIQDKGSILSVHSSSYKAIHRLMNDVLDYLHQSRVKAR